MSEEPQCCGAQANPSNYVLREWYDNVKRLWDVSVKDLEMVRKHRDDIQNQVTSLRNNLERTAQSLDQAKKVNEDLRNKLDSARLSIKLTPSEADYVELRHAKDVLQHQLTSCRQQLETLRAAMPTSPSAFELDEMRDAKGRSEKREAMLIEANRGLSKCCEELEEELNVALGWKSAHDKLAKELAAARVAHLDSCETMVKRIEELKKELSEWAAKCSKEKSTVLEQADNIRFLKQEVEKFKGDNRYSRGYDHGHDAAVKRMREIQKEVTESFFAKLKEVQP